MGFTIPPGMTLEQMLVVMGQAESVEEPAAEPEPAPKASRKKPAAPEPES